jgi:hypothetical protein
MLPASSIQWNSAHSTLLEKGKMPMDNAEYSSTGYDTSDMEMTNFTFNDGPSIWKTGHKLGRF